MFRIYIPSQYKVDVYRQVSFEPSLSYTCVEVHYRPLHSDIADSNPTTTQPLRPETSTSSQKSTEPIASPPSTPEH